MTRFEKYKRDLTVEEHAKEHENSPVEVKE